MAETAQPSGNSKKQQDGASESPPTPQFPLREIDAETLLAGEKQVVIRHAGEAYRLILTRNNRLILQK